MSMSLHSAELGFTLIKEGLRKSVGPSPAEGSPLHQFASFLPSFAPFSCSPLHLHAAHVHPIQKRKKKKQTLSSAFPPVCLRSISLHSASKYRRGKKGTKTQINYLDFFPKQRRKNAWLCSLKEKGKEGKGGGVRNKNCIRYKIPQSARDIKN